MAYNSEIINQQLQDLQRQYQELQKYQQPVIQPNIQQFQPIPLPVQSRQVQYVEGLSGAKIYQQNLPSNSSEIIMDKDDNIFYLVSKDANGTPARKIPVGRFTIEENQDDEPAYLTRKDFDDFKEEIRLLFQENKNITQKPVSKATTSSTKA